MEVHCQSATQETVSMWAEGMMEQLIFTGEGLPHSLQQWASTSVTFRMQIMLPIDFM